MPPHNLGRQAKIQTHLTNFILEQRAQRLDEVELQVVGKATDVVVALDVGRARAATGFHDVGIERALYEELHGLVGARCIDDGPRRILEHPDELATNDLALGLGVAHVGERIKETSPGIDNNKTNPGGRHIVALDLLSLALAQ